MWRIQKLKKGERISAEHYAAVTDGASRTFSGNVANGREREVFVKTPRPPEGSRQFEATSAPQKDSDNVYFVTAKFRGLDSDMQYATSTGIDYTVYFPLMTDDDAELVSSGDRFFAHWSPSLIRWTYTETPICKHLGSIPAPENLPSTFYFVGLDENNKCGRLELCDVLETVPGYSGDGTKYLADDCTFKTVEGEGGTGGTDVCSQLKQYPITTEWPEEGHLIVTDTASGACSRISVCDVLGSIESATLSASDELEFFVRKTSTSPSDPTSTCNTVTLCDLFDALPAQSLNNGTYELIVKKQDLSTGGAALGDPSCVTVNFCDMLFKPPDEGVATSETISLPAKVTNNGSGQSECRTVLFCDIFKSIPGYIGDGLKVLTDACEFIEATSSAICTQIGALATYSTWMSGDNMRLVARITRSGSPTDCYKVSPCDVFKYMLLNSGADPSKSYVMVFPSTEVVDGQGNAVLGSWGCQFYPYTSGCACSPSEIPLPE